MVQKLESELRNKLNIPSLKIKSNRQIGWFIEVTNSHLDKVPEEWLETTDDQRVKIYNRGNY